jgi:hypothetical protein
LESTDVLEIFKRIDNKILSRTNNPTVLVEYLFEEETLYTLSDPAILEICLYMYFDIALSSLCQQMQVKL